METARPTGSALATRPVEDMLLQEHLGTKDCLAIRHAVRSQKRERRRLEEMSAGFAERFAARLPERERDVRQGLILWVLGRLEAARGLLEHDGRESPLALFVLGAMAEEEGDLHGALERYRAAEEKDLASPELAARVAAVLRMLARREEAHAEIEKARGRFGESPDLLAEEGACLEEEGEHERAFGLYERGLALREGHQGCAFRAAVLLDLRGEEEKAAAYYRICVGTSSSYVSAMLNMGLIHEERGEAEEAIARYRTVLRVHPNHVRARLFLRDALASLDERYDEAERKEQERREMLLRMLISDFDLSVRSRNCLRRMKIWTLGDLIQHTESELLSYRNFGETSLQEIKQILEPKNLELGMGLQEAERRRREARLAEEMSPERAELLARPIADLDLSVRSRKCMSRLGVATIGELAERTEDELMAVKNFGQTSLHEIRAKLAERDLRLRSPEEEEEV